jgi:glycosyltransferase involved in cell wall biosynthesis
MSVVNISIAPRTPATVLETATSVVRLNALAGNPQVTCLTITQPGREALLANAIGDFARQRYVFRDLLIVHDGDAAFHSHCEALIQQPRDGLQPVIGAVLKLPSGYSLGQLRNYSVENARGELMCQWDDDDRSHPDRIAVQVEALRRESAVAAYLCQQLHYFADTDELFCEDFRREPYPLNVVQGSALVRKDSMPRYPDLQRGEDTALLNSLLQTKLPIARISGQPWLFCYGYHGDNTFAREHHATMVAAHALSPAAMMNIRSPLNVALAQYDPGVRRALASANSASSTL